MSLSVRHHQRRHIRSAAPPPLHITERDTATLAAVAQYRVLTQKQLTRLIFKGSEASYRRLRLLYHHGYLARQFLPTTGGLLTSPILYLLDRKGADFLRKTQPDLTWKKAHNSVSSEFLAHALAINEVRILTTLACQQSQRPLVEWVGEQAMKQHYDWVFLPAQEGQKRRISVIPDSYLVIGEQHQNTGTRACFALELDRGTMSLKRFKLKVQAYIAYLETGAYQQRYKTKSLRILIVAESQKRLANLKRITESAGGKSRFWFATLSALTAENILTQPVWEVAGRAGYSAILKEPPSFLGGGWQQLFPAYQVVRLVLLVTGFQAGGEAR